jgi:hypothetical protein
MKRIKNCDRFFTKIFKKTQNDRGKKALEQMRAALKESDQQLSNTTDGQKTLYKPGKKLTSFSANASNYRGLSIGR